MNIRYKNTKKIQSDHPKPIDFEDNSIIEDTSQKLARELFGLFLIFLGLLIFLSLISHDQRDPSLNHVVSDFSQAYNHAGIFGAYISGLLVDIFGISALVWPAIFIAWGAGCISTWLTIPWWRWLGFFLLASCLISFGAAWNLGIGDVRGGGILGLTIYNQCSLIFGTVGSTVIWLFLFFISLEFAFGIAWLNLLHTLNNLIKKELKNYNFSLILNYFSKLSIQPLLQFLQLNERQQTIDVIPLYDIHEAPISIPNNYSLPKSIASALHITSIDYYHSEKSYEATPHLKDYIKPEHISHTSQYSAHQKPLSTQNIDVYEQIALNNKNSSKEDMLYQENQDTLSQNSFISNEQDIQKNQPNIVQPLTSKTANTFSTHHQEKQNISLSQNSQQLEKNTQNNHQPNKALLYPPLSLLNHSSKKDILPSPLTLKEKSKLLMDCLTDFNIQGELVRITPGPVITLFEIRPAPGVRVNRIVGLSDDLARSLMAEAVRVQAPIPGSDTVGIEIPNANRSPVCFHSLMNASIFQESTSPLTIALGKDIEGKPTIKDLATMPHVLVAGTTGSGKSVCLNTILLSFLYKSSPNNLKLMLIDPKRVELAMYTHLPHLVHPVITETALAKTALEWAVYEMDRRYNCLAQLGVKHITDFNKKILSFGNNKPQPFHDLEFLPYFVIIIDELADLMMTAGKEIEASIVRLAQLARAAGIHLIVATQRPSVDVVTGLIKANFPCRIAFQVANKYDSRTILDATGAEQLLGKGDMLFKPNGGKIQRLHGAFVTDDEVHAVTEHWRNQQTPLYTVDFSEWNNITNNQSTSPRVPSTSTNEDKLYAEAVNFVQEQGKMSISLLQRRFRIGFNKAARFVERMEEEGILPPAARGNKARTVKFN